MVFFFVFPPTFPWWGLMTSVFSKSWPRPRDRHAQGSLFTVFIKENVEKSVLILNIK